jgi:hypothetical protein
MSVNSWLVLSVLFLVHWTKPIGGQMGRPVLQRRLIQNPHPNDYHQNKLQYRDDHPQPDPHDQYNPISDIHQMSYSGNEAHQSEASNTNERPYYPRPQEPPPYYYPPPPRKNSLAEMQGQLVEKFSAMFGRGDYGGGGYGGGGGYSGGGYDGGCCGGLFDWRTTLPAYALLLVTFFLLYLLNSAVTSSSGRKFNSAASGDPGDEGIVDNKLNLFH